MRISIRQKLVISLLSVTFSTALLLGFLAYRFGKSAIEQNVISNFEPLCATKQQNVTWFLRHVKSHVRAIADSEYVARDIRQCRDAFEKLPDLPLSKDEEIGLESHYRNVVLAKFADPEITAETIIPRSNKARALQYRRLVATETKADRAAASTNSTDPRTEDYERIYRSIHTRLQRIIDLYDFEDMLVIHPKTLEIFMTVAGKIDTGTDLVNGPFADTLLAKTIRTIAGEPENDSVRMTDFERYLPSYGRPSSFFVCPMKSDGEILAYFAIQIPIDLLNSLMIVDQKAPQTGLGRTGEIFLVGEDTYMRTNSRFLMENPAKYLQELRTAGLDPKVIRDVQRYRTTVLTVPRQSELVRSLFGKGSNTVRTTGYLGHSVIASYAKIDIPDVRWGIIALIDTDEAFAAIRRFHLSLLALTFMSLIASTLLAIYVARALSSPLQHMTMAARAIAGGFRNVRVNVKSKDELEVLANSFNEMAAVVETERSRQLLIANENERLMETLMPPRLIAELWASPQSWKIIGAEGDTTVAYARISGMSRLYSQFEPNVAVAVVESLGASFDEASHRFGVQKLNFGSSGYFAICGLHEIGKDHSERILEFAWEMQKIVDSFNARHGLSLFMTTAIHRGRVSGGSIGYRDFFHEIWRKTLDLTFVISDTSGNAMNLICVTQAVFETLKDKPHVSSSQYGLDSSGQPVWHVWISHDMRIASTPQAN